MAKATRPSAEQLETTAERLAGELARWSRRPVTIRYGLSSVTNGAFTGGALPIQVDDELLKRVRLPDKYLQVFEGAILQSAAHLLQPVDSQLAEAGEARYVFLILNDEHTLRNAIAANPAWDSPLQALVDLVLFTRDKRNSSTIQRLSLGGITLDPPALYTVPATVEYAERLNLWAYHFRGHESLDGSTPPYIEAADKLVPVNFKDLSKDDVLALARHIHETLAEGIVAEQPPLPEPEPEPVVEPPPPPEPEPEPVVEVAKEVAPEPEPAAEEKVVEEQQPLPPEEEPAPPPPPPPPPPAEEKHEPEPPPPPAEPPAEAVVVDPDDVAEEAVEDETAEPEASILTVDSHQESPVEELVIELPPEQEPPPAEETQPPEEVKIQAPADADKPVVTDLKEAEETPWWENKWLLGTVAGSALIWMGVFMKGGVTLWLVVTTLVALGVVGAAGYAAYHHVRVWAATSAAFHATIDKIVAGFREAKRALGEFAEAVFNMLAAILGAIGAGLRWCRKKIGQGLRFICDLIVAFFTHPITKKVLMGLAWLAALAVTVEAYEHLRIYVFLPVFAVAGLLTVCTYSRVKRARAVAALAGANGAMPGGSRGAGVGRSGSGGFGGSLGSLDVPFSMAGFDMSMETAATVMKFTVLALCAVFALGIYLAIAGAGGGWHFHLRLWPLVLAFLAFVAPVAIASMFVTSASERQGYYRGGSSALGNLFQSTLEVFGAIFGVIAIILGVIWQGLTILWNAFLFVWKGYIWWAISLVSAYVWDKICIASAFIWKWTCIVSAFIWMVVTIVASAIWWATCTLARLIKAGAIALAVFVTECAVLAWRATRHGIKVARFKLREAGWNIEPSLERLWANIAFRASIMIAMPLAAVGCMILSIMLTAARHNVLLVLPMVVMLAVTLVAVAFNYKRLVNIIVAEPFFGMPELTGTSEGVPLDRSTREWIPITDVRRVYANQAVLAQLMPTVTACSRPIRDALEQLGESDADVENQRTGATLGENAHEVVRGNLAIRVDSRPKKLPSVYVGVGLDCSSSEKLRSNYFDEGGKFLTLQTMGLILEHGMVGQKRVAGHLYGYVDTLIHDCGLPGDFAASGLECRGGNNDTAMLDILRQEALASDKEIKIIIMMNDSQPADCSALSFNDMVSRCRREGIYVIQMVTDDSHPAANDAIVISLCRNSKRNAAIQLAQALVKIGEEWAAG